ncbi:MAG: cytochrome c [Nitrospiraceae bacterium]|nr:cytochrome c [Nitrospiraceae bacterium]MBX9841825.1 cytochrome c [Xanthobacteraceae bacterium]
MLLHIRQKCLVLLLVCCGQASPALGQAAFNSDDVKKGRYLAFLVCANCHVVAPDQPNEPILRQPAPSFASIAQRPSITREWLENFIATTHQGFDNSNGMPNPRLLDNQVRQVATYLLSLRKQP